MCSSAGGRLRVVLVRDGPLAVDPAVADGQADDQLDLVPARLRAGAVAQRAEAALLETEHDAPSVHGDQDANTWVSAGRNGLPERLVARGAGLAARHGQECRGHDVDSIRSLRGSAPLGQGGLRAPDLDGLELVDDAARPGALDVLPVLLRVGVAEGGRVCDDANIAEARPLHCTRQVVGFGDPARRPLGS
jgi:hypothetical protein